MLIIKFTLLFTCLLIFLTNVWSFTDPLTLTALAGVGAGLGLWNIDSLKKHTICKYMECCINTEVRTDFKELEMSLSKRLYGQHIVQKILLPALITHVTNHRSKKPLVISFHGTPGTGKNYVADMIAEAFYRKGLKSKFVHKFMGRADFPRSDDVDLYIQRINDVVRKAIRTCPQSLFIFDEVDKMPRGIFDALTSLLNYNPIFNGQDSSASIFIFLSNVGGVEIAERLGKLLQEGTLRESTKLSDFESILLNAAYNVEGGFQRSRMIETQVVDHYIPFLPLEKSHLYQCVKYYLKDLNIHQSSLEDLDEIIDSVVTYDPTYGIFAKSGCKKLYHKAAVYFYHK